MRFRPFYFLLITSLLFSLPLASGQELVVQYTFDEESGPAIDSGMGDRSNGTLGPETTRAANTPGMVSPFALDLRAAGTDSFVNAGDAAEVDTLESFTLTTWLLLEGLNADSDGSGNVRLIAKQGADPFDGFSWNLNGPNFGVRGTDSFRTGLFIGGETAFDFAFASEDSFADEWAFLAVTYDGTLETENAGFYFGDTENEVFLLSDFFEDLNAGPVNSTQGVADFGIGFTDAAPGVDFAADGFMDDVRVYDGVLSLEQLEEVRMENLIEMTVLACDPETGGDTNADGAVNFTDFLILSENFGNAVTSHMEGDLDCDGTVAFPDFLILSDNFGRTAGVASVPEPTTSLFALISFALLAIMNRRRR